MDHPHELVNTTQRLDQLLRPILGGLVDLVAFDTETTLVEGGRFTPWGTSTRIAGYSIAYVHRGRTASFYVPIRHVPYDWRRRPDLIAGDTAHDGPKWLERLEHVERVLCDLSEAPGWQPGADPNLSPQLGLKYLANAMAVPEVRWVAHNWPFDAKQLQADGIEPPWDRLEDTQALSVLTDERPLDKWDDSKKGYLHGGHALKHLGEVYLNVPADAQKLLDQAKSALGPGGQKLQDYSMLPLVTAIAPYASMDTYLVLMLFQLMMQRPAAQDRKVMELYRKHVAEVRVSTGMEHYGIGVRTDEVPKAVAAQERQVGEAITRCTQLAGRPLPLDNGKELANVLYADLGLPTYRGMRNTRKATLKQVRQRLASAADVPTGGRIAAADAVSLVDSILDYRKKNKLLTAFYRPLGGFTDEGRVHSVLSPLGTKTTRYSAQAPNVQQAPKPKKGEEDDSPRRLFVPKPGHVFVFADYSQIELRITSHFSMAIPEAFQYVFKWKCTLERRGDCKGRGEHGPGVEHYGWRPNYSARPDRCVLFDGFMSGDTSFDPHQSMADVSGRDRSTSKGANFALLYGAFPNKLAETLEIPVADARKLFRQFWDEAYPELGHLKQFVEERLRRVGKPTKFCGRDYLTTLHGGRVYLEGGHKGLNYLVQRSAREVLLNAVLDVDRYLQEVAPSYKMVLPIHDELVFEVPEADLDEATIRGLCQVMVKAGSASKVPMLVEPEVATVDWAHKEPLHGWGWNGVTGAAA